MNIRYGTTSENEVSQLKIKNFLDFAIKLYVIVEKHKILSLHMSVMVYIIRKPAKKCV